MSVKLKVVSDGTAIDHDINY